MNKKEIKLSVKNLTISFRTEGGKVQAVRGVNFDLNKGETLAIVGESGSGKSVTNRAIMGILSSNAIKEKGEIIYEGKDLFSLSEKEFCSIRGDKIAMIFQDPMSSLNPLMKVGKQLTEAMIIKEKLHKKTAKQNLKKAYKKLKKILGKENKNKYIIFKNVVKTYSEMKAKWDMALEFSSICTKYIDEELSIIEKQNINEKIRSLKYIIEYIKKVNYEYFTLKDYFILKEKIYFLEKLFKKHSINKICSKIKITNLFKCIELENLENYLIEFKDILLKSNKKVDLFSISGYIYLNKGKPQFNTIDELNSKTKRIFNDNFFSSFKKILKEKKEEELIDYIKNNAIESKSLMTKYLAKKRGINLLKEVGIDEPEKRFNQYPFEFSGGQRQRIVIAIALSLNPDILICDEPTTALDVTIQSQILELINKVKKERKLSIIFITHDLGVVANMADRVAVMYAGKIVEIGTVEDIFFNSAHPYTWALLSSMPNLDTKGKLDSIGGVPPDMLHPPKGDAFAKRNKYALKIDLEREPPMFKISESHYAATWLLHPNAPKIKPPDILGKEK